MLYVCKARVGFVLFLLFISLVLLILLLLILLQYSLSLFFIHFPVGRSLNTRQPYAQTNIYMDSICLFLHILKNMRIENIVIKSMPYDPPANRPAGGKNTTIYFDNRNEFPTATENPMLKKNVQPTNQYFIRTFSVSFASMHIEIICFELLILLSRCLQHGGTYLK